MSLTAPGQISLTRPPKTDDELHSLVQAIWGVNIPRAKVCPEHDPPFSWFADSFFGRQPITLAKGSRGLSGKSYAMSALGLTQAVVWGADVNILGGSLAQSQNLHAHMRDAWDYPGSPRYMVTNDGDNRMLLTNGAQIRPLTASQKTVRGPHPARLLLDEVDEIKQDIFDAAKGQPMPQKNWLGITIPAQTAMTSTLQYADGVMVGEISRMKDLGLHVHEWCWRESLIEHGGWLDPAFVEQKRMEMPAEMWRVEYELGEPSIGNRAFDSQAIEATFAEQEPTYISNTKSHQEVALQKYRIDRDYVISADWAKTKDFTVVTVWDVTDMPMTLAYYVRINRRQYPVMINIFNKLQQAYYAAGIHDATGLGGVVTDYIQGDAWNFQMTGRQRDDMLSDYVAAVENDRVRAPKIHSLYSEHKFCIGEGSLVRTKRGLIPIEQVQVGDYALTRKGFRPVVRAVCNGSKLVSQLRTSDGHELFLTEDHRVSTPTGWVEAQFLQPGDGVHVTAAGSTQPSVSLSSLVDHQVVSGKQVPEPALVGGSPVLPHSGNVVGVTAGVQVPGVDALGDAAHMVNVPSLRNFSAVGKHPTDSMGQVGAELLTGQPGVSPGIDVSLPDPALSGDQVASVFSGGVGDDVAHSDGGSLGLPGVSHVVSVVPTRKTRKVYDLTIAGDAPEFYANGVLVHNCSWEDMFSRGKEFHLPDTVCAAALAWKLAADRHPAVSPASLKRSDMNWMSKAVEHNVSPQSLEVDDPKDTSYPGVQGEVKNKSEEFESMFT